jgi:protein-tyrosine phosphatase
VTAIEFEGVINFRDFGGAAGAGGARLREGLLFRSGHHAAATEADLARIAAMDFALLVDLRRPPERLRDPARRPAGGRARLLEHAGPVDGGVPPHLTFLAEPGATPQKVSDQMIVGYQYYPFDPFYVAVYRDYFAALAELDGPVLINCHAGKDRTGWLAALTLHLLGASREAIFADYMATNAHNRADQRMGEMAAHFEATYGHVPDEALMRAILMVQPRWLEAAFEAVAAEHGDADAYLAEVAGVTSVMKAQIRERLLA